MDIPKSVLEFYETAKNLWDQIYSIRECDESNIEGLLKALAELYLKALYLPNPELHHSEELSDLEETRLNSVSEMESLYCWEIYRAPNVDFKSKNHYHEFFDPYDAGSTVTASLSDDINDILEEVGTGIYLYEHGYQTDAAFEWKNSFMIHWGEHITGAIRALNSMYYPIWERNVYGDDEI